MIWAVGDDFRRQSIIMKREDKLSTTIFRIRDNMIGLIQKIIDLFLAKDTSDEKLLEHLKNIGIDAEIIPTGSVDDPRIKRNIVGPKYSFSIGLKGLNIDVIQINYYNFGYEYASYVGYRIDYIVRGFYKDKWHLKKKIKKLEGSVEKKVVPDKENKCVRIYIVNPLFQEEEIVIEEGERRVTYKYLKDTDFPSRETIEAYDKIALNVRTIIENA